MLQGQLFQSDVQSNIPAENQEIGMTGYIAKTETAQHVTMFKLLDFFLQNISRR